MKQASNPKLIKQDTTLKSLDGPPIDFAFKSMRSLNELMENMPSLKMQTQTSEQKDNIKINGTTFNSTDAPSNGNNKMNVTNKKVGQAKESEKLNENQLQIVRTIETTDHNYMEAQHKKSVTQKEKIQKKAKKMVFPQTTSLFLGYNKLTSIQNFIQMVEPIFPNLYTNLMWVDLCHNRLVQLSPDLGSLKNLKTLYLHANYISNFAELEKVKGAQQLRTLTIHANPLEAYDQFRIIVHSIFPSLKKLDSTLLTKRQTQRAEVLMKSMKKYPIIKNAKKPPEESENEEEDNA